ncbi:OmpA family protein [Salmonirosea aquatica]|uniref:OmpA family protein n=1 Tax=Salmonirosea aquatica TaxID=2654236 RepID=A0A7C9FYE2_9BACT|nr:OmpA family protein [Cytophagaceae bacterium SJW1-29]
MRILPFSAWLLVLGLSLGTAQAQITDRPYVEERYSRRVSIVRVTLSEQYTIVDMQYGQPGRATLFNPFGLSNYTIQIDPKSRLYRPGDTSRRYRFIKAEGIPVTPEKKSVLPGEVVNFRLYYERLDPGIEVFDLYEGRNADIDLREENYEFWNFYGIHIKNPRSPRSEPRVPPSSPPKKSIPKEEPKEDVPIQRPPLQEPPLLDKVPEDVTITAPEIVGLMGTVYDAKTRKPIPAQLQYVDQGDSMRVGTSSGKYRLGLNGSGRYSVGAAAKGYLSTSMVVSPADSAGKNPLTYDFYLTPLAEGASITLEKIYFATSEYELLPESFDELNALVGMLRENPSMKIRIEGHTDNLGDFDKNVELSRNRANAVRDYLIKKGIDAQRLEAKGYGPTRPVGKGNSEAERQKNRRVEFVVTQI